MKGLVLAFLICLAFVISASSQEARKIDEFNDIFCDEAKARMDLIGMSLRDTPESKIYMIYYTGKTYRKYVYDEKLKSRKEVFLSPQTDESKMIILRWKNYLKRVQGVSENNIILVDGGFREEHTLENWIVPNGVESPKPTPTLTEKDVKFRKGRTRYVECTV